LKLHRPVAQTVISALSQIFGEGYHADKVIERALKSRREFGARDRRFIAETVYEMVRWWRYLWEVAGDPESTETEDLWRLLGIWLTILRDGKGEELPSWPEFKEVVAGANEIRRRAELVKQNPAVRESVPDWLFDRGCVELGAAVWERYLHALNQPAPVILRANTLRTTQDKLRQQLAAEDIDALVAAPLTDGLRLAERKNVFITKAFQSGLFEVQDGASQQVAPMLDPQPGERVIDACAGAGGKSLHLAALMKNRGKILALDVHERKLEELRKRAARAGADIIETRVIESTKVIKRLENSADRLLLDVPCSGLGVLRRNPDTKWKLTPEELERLGLLQAQLLETYTKMLKPGGRLVYATCSVLPSENEKQVQAFLTKHGERYSLIEEHKFVPGEHAFDGFYAASLSKN
jgi:16S rRNA (cytosine967-C5)-methyltransferase